MSRVKIEERKNKKVDEKKGITETEEDNVRMERYQLDMGRCLASVLMLRPAY